MKIIPIEGAYITLGQLLKKTDIVSTGGQAKMFLAEREVKVNGQTETRRGRKLYPGDEIRLHNGVTMKIVGKSDANA